jgi:A/G-specific adenine glycosylase
VSRWGEAARRDLPWRATRQPWAILVSEFMLAQTQVTRVVPRWDAFLARWPTPTACAQAPLGEVIAAWNGLGYNRRAVFLHRAATAIVDRHEGVVPDDLSALLALSGVGPYTARAVLAFAFEHRVGVVDTNAARVLARAFAGRTLGHREAQAWADAAVPAGAGWAWNQAMLDLGAIRCTARRPACDGCPLGPGSSGPPLCRWAAAGGPDPAAGSAGTSRPQSTFSGSDRQGRGRLLATLAAGPAGPAAGGLSWHQWAAAAGWPDDPARAAAAAAGLVADGLAVVGEDGSLGLP